MVQIGTENIGLRAFPAQRKVPGIRPECDCGEAIQTPKHVISMPEHIGWPDGMATERGDSRLHGHHFYKGGTAYVGAQWMMEPGVLQQFTIAREMVIHTVVL
jgi:hypothetical protein